MTEFDERPAPSAARRRLPLLGLGLPVLAVLIWVIAAHSPSSVKHAIGEFRGDAPVDTDSNQPMADALQIRRSLLMHPEKKLSSAQGRRLVEVVGTPINDQSQSEALDVLSLAQRAHALSGPQARDADVAALGALRVNPGPMVRLEGARLLGHLENPADAPVLAALRQDSDPKVQKAAEEALNRLVAPKN